MEITSFLMRKAHEATTMSTTSNWEVALRNLVWYYKLLNTTATRVTTVWLDLSAEMNDPIARLVTDTNRHTETTSGTCAAVTVSAVVNTMNLRLAVQKHFQINQSHLANSLADLLNENGFVLQYCIHGQPTWKLQHAVND